MVAQPDFTDPAKWKVYKDLNIFAVHSRKWTNPKTKKNHTIRFSRRRLEKIVDNNNKRDRIGQPCPLTIGHTDNDKPEREQPEIVGYARHFKVAFDHKLQSWVARADYYISADKVRLAMEYPRTSVEIYPGANVIDPIALLKRTPQLDLGQWTYGRGRRWKLRYSMDDYVGKPHKRRKSRRRIGVDDDRDAIDRDEKKDALDDFHFERESDRSDEGAEEVDDDRDFDDEGAEDMDGDRDRDEGEGAEDMDGDRDRDEGAEDMGDLRMDGGRGPDVDPEFHENFRKCMKHYGAKGRRTKSDKYGGDGGNDVKDATPPQRKKRMQRDSQAIHLSRLEQQVAEQFKAIRDDLKLVMGKNRDLIVERDTERCERMLVQLEAEGYRFDREVEVERMLPMNEADRGAHVKYIKRHHAKAPIGSSTDVDRLVSSSPVKLTQTSSSQGSRITAKGGSENLRRRAPDDLADDDETNRALQYMRRHTLSGNQGFDEAMKAVRNGHEED